MGREHLGAALLEREEALSTLEAAFGAVVAGRGGVALVSGEAGIGKTSLVRAFVATERRATRVLFGACDDLAVPRPLGPFLDIAGGLPRLAAELGTGGVDAPRLVLDELSRSGATICIVEDAHWADDATIDVLTYVARRIETLPALLVVSFRDDEVGPDHPLHRALAAAPAGLHAPARAGAPERRRGRAARGRGRRRDGPARDHGRQPVLRPRGAGERPGAHARRACATRCSRAPRASRGGRGRSPSWSACSPPVPRCRCWRRCAGSVDAGVAECERGGLLALDHDLVGFRHELARWAVEESLAGSRRHDLNRVVLRELERRDATPARLAHHAWAAGDAGSDRAARPRRGTRCGRGALASRSRGAADPRARVRAPARPARAGGDARAAVRGGLLRQPAGARRVRAAARARAPARARRAAGHRRDAALAVAHPLAGGRWRLRRARRRRGGRAAGAVPGEPRAGDGAQQPLAARDARRSATTMRCAGAGGRSRWRSGSTTPRRSCTRRRTSARPSRGPTSTQASSCSRAPRRWRSTAGSTSTAAEPWSTWPGNSRTSGATSARGRRSSAAWPSPASASSTSTWSTSSRRVR